MSSVATDEATTAPPEVAPSNTRREEPVIARLIGLFGLGCTVLGVAAIVANQYGPRLIGEGFGYLCASVGLASLMFHAVRDSDPEVRRVYGIGAALLLVVAIVVGVMPGRPAPAAPSVYGYYLLPWGAVAGLLSLLFFVPFSRHETEEPYRNATHLGLLAVGGLLGVGSIVGGLIKPEFLVGPGVALALLGLGFFAAYLSVAGTDDGLGYKAAVALGILGGVALVLAIGKTVVPSLLHDGPKALLNARQSYDRWLVAGRVISIAFGLAVAGHGAFGKGVAPWFRGVLVILGLAWTGAFVVGSFTAPLTSEPTPFLVPYGLILGFIGLLYLGVSLASVSDDVVVVMTRRELSAYFYSPIAYTVLVGMAFVLWLGYFWFLGGVFGSRRALMEPILQNYVGATTLAGIAVVFLVPALTMWTFAEERRTGTLEVLLTAPVNEFPVVLSKFLAAWLFFMLSLVPIALYLIPLRIEGGQPFDYRPLLSYYLAVGACGAGFVGMGLFFSSLTRNQIVAAMLTCAGMFALLLTVVLRGQDFIPDGLRAAIGKLDYLTLWSNALAGQLMLTDVFIQLSLAVFWLFLTVKVLEARKWS